MLNARRRFCGVFDIVVCQPRPPSNDNTGRVKFVQIIYAFAAGGDGILYKLVSFAMDYSNCLWGYQRQLSVLRFLPKVILSRHGRPAVCLADCGVCGRIIFESVLLYAFPNDHKFCRGGLERCDGCCALC